MSSPLTDTRNKKVIMLKDMLKEILEILLYPKGSLDRADMRHIKEILKKLKMLKERAEPA